MGKEKSYLFVAIDRITKFVFVKLYDRQTPKKHFGEVFLAERAGGAI